MAKEIAKYIGVAIVLAYLFFGYLKPMLYKMMGKDKETLEAIEAEKRAQEEIEKEEEEAAIVNLSREAELQNTRHGSSYEMNLEMAKQLAKDDPRIVANVVKAWVSNE